MTGEFEAFIVSENQLKRFKNVFCFICNYNVSDVVTPGSAAEGCGLESPNSDASSLVIIQPAALTEAEKSYTGPDCGCLEGEIWDPSLVSRSLIFGIIYQLCFYVNPFCKPTRLVM